MAIHTWNNPNNLNYSQFFIRNNTSVEQGRTFGPLFGLFLANLLAQIVSSTKYYYANSEHFLDEEYPTIKPWSSYQQHFYQHQPALMDYTNDYGQHTIDQNSYYDQNHQHIDYSNYWYPIQDPYGSSSTTEYPIYPPLTTSNSLPHLNSVYGPFRNNDNKSNSSIISSTTTTSTTTTTTKRPSTIVTNKPKKSSKIQKRSRPKKQRRSTTTTTTDTYDDYSEENQSFEELSTKHSKSGTTDYDEDSFENYDNDGDGLPLAQTVVTTKNPVKMLTNLNDVKKVITTTTTTTTLRPTTKPKIRTTFTNTPRPTTTPRFTTTSFHSQNNNPPNFVNCSDCNGDYGPSNGNEFISITYGPPPMDQSPPSTIYTNPDPSINEENWQFPTSSVLPPNSVVNDNIPDINNWNNNNQSPHGPRRPMPSSNWFFG